MVYTMEIWVDGACRGNGQPGAVGASTAVFKTKYGKTHAWTQILPEYPAPTNQRAEITGIIIALEKALEKYETLDTNPYLDVKIHANSRYAIGCMTDWAYKWTRNGWINSAGSPVANCDLIEKVSKLMVQLKEEGKVTYQWIPRDQNEEADRYCNDALDQHY